MNLYDQAARYAVKGDPIGFLRWLVPGLPTEMEFRGWLDTRTLPFPGEPDRTSDTVAHLLDPSDPPRRWALATEFQAEPDPHIVDRLLEYLARLRRELRHGPKRKEKFHVAAALVYLTGPPCADTLDMTLPGDASYGLRLRVASKALRDESAASTLAEIAGGRTSRWLLAWIPLMKGAAKPTMLEEWVRLANLEPNPRWRADYAALALIFAGLTRHSMLWKQALEGWNMRESAIVLEWMAEWKAEGIAEGKAEGMAKGKAEGMAKGKAEGKAEGRREALLDLLRIRFPAQLSEDLLAALNAESDLGTLARWLVAAEKSASIEEFRTLANL